MQAEIVSIADVSKPPRRQSYREGRPHRRRRDASQDERNGEALHHWRLTHQMMQSELAALLGVSATTVSRWECGANSINTPVMLWRALDHIERGLPVPKEVFGQKTTTP